MTFMGIAKEFTSMLYGVCKVPERISKRFYRDFYEDSKGIQSDSKAFLQGF